MRRSILPCLVLLAITGLSLALNLVGIGFGQPRHYDQSVDGVHPTFSLDAVRNLTGERHEVGLKYPRLHFLILGAWQRGWLALGSGVEEGTARHDALMGHFDDASPLAQVALRDSYRPFRATISQLIVVGRVLSALMGVGVVLGIFLLSRELWDSLVGYVASFLTALCYPLSYYAHTLNVDVPYLFWGVFALYFAARSVRTGAARDILIAAVLAASCVATKDQGYGLFLFTTPLLFWLLARPGKLADPPRRPFPLRAVIVAVAVSVTVYLIAHGVPFDMPGVWGHFDHIFGDGVKPFRAFPHSLDGHRLLLAESGLHLLDGLGLVTLVMSAVGVVVMLVKNRQAAALTLVPGVSYYATFIMPIGYVYLRFTLPIMLVLIVSASVAFAALLRRPGARYVAAVLLLVTAGQRMDLAVRMNALLSAEPRSAAHEYLMTELPKGARVAALIDLPMHNVELPGHARVTYLGVGSLPRFGDDPPEFFITSFFDPPRTIADPSPPTLPVLDSIRQFARDYDLEAAFPPIAEHPLRAGAAFQPTVLVYRLRPLGGE